MPDISGSKEGLKNQENEPNRDRNRTPSHNQSERQERFRLANRRLQESIDTAPPREVLGGTESDESDSSLASLPGDELTISPEEREMVDQVIANARRSASDLRDVIRELGEDINGNEDERRVRRRIDHLGERQPSPNPETEPGAKANATKGSDPPEAGR